MYLNLQLAALTFVLTRGQGETTQSLPSVLTGPSGQTSGVPSSHPGADGAECKLGSLCTEEPPMPGSPSAKFPRHPFSYIPQSSWPFRLLNITNDTIWGGRSETQDFDQAVIRKKVTKESLALQYT